MVGLTFPMRTTRHQPRPQDWEVSLGELLRRAAVNWPDREALVIGAVRLSYAELYATASELARRLRNRGIGRGSHVALMGNNTVEWVVAYFGVALAGAVLIPVNPRFSPREIRYVLRKSRCDLLLAQAGLSRLLQQDIGQTGEDLAPVLRLGVVEYAAGCDRFGGLPAGGTGAPLPMAEPDDTAVIMFTSGSTAFPKGCMLTHLGMARNAFLHDTRLHLGANDRWFGPTPFFHASGCIWGILSVTAVGATMVSCEKFDAEESLRILEREQCTYQHGIDTICVRQLEIARNQRFDLSRLKKGTSTGPLSLLCRIRDELGIEYVMSKWGVTEGYGNLALCDIDDPLERRLGSHGRIYEPFQYRISDPEHANVALPTGRVGEIQVRGASMQGYYDDPAATRAIMLADGWLRTGDLGRLDGDFLYYTGRLKDMLKIGGENVAASEIEAVLIRHPAVLNVAVVGRSHAEWGETAVAFIELVNGGAATEAELSEHCRQNLAGIKVPRRFVFLREFPRTGSGKVDKKLLPVD